MSCVTTQGGSVSECGSLLPRAWVQCTLGNSLAVCQAVGETYHGHGGLSVLGMWKYENIRLLKYKNINY